MSVITPLQGGRGVKFPTEKPVKEPLVTHKNIFHGAIFT